MEPSLQRRCRHCEQPLPTGSRSHRQYCSDRCRSRACNARRGAQATAAIHRRQAQARAQRQRSERPPGICPQCGAEFVVNHGRRKYCSRACSTRASTDRVRTTDRAGYRVRRRNYAARRRQSVRTTASGTLVVPDEIFRRDRWRCHLCRRPVRRRAVVPHPLAPTLDHLIPLAVGGLHVIENVATAHFLCNSRKQAKACGGQLALLG